jgi:hypothetical protein
LGLLSRLSLVLTRRTTLCRLMADPFKSFVPAQRMYVQECSGDRLILAHPDPQTQVAALYEHIDPKLIVEEMTKKKEDAFRICDRLVG